DFDFYEIPDEVSIGGIVLAPLASVLVPELHRYTWLAQRYSEGAEVTRVGGGALLAIGWIGARLLGKEAMGLGDVKLLAAAGGFVGPGGALFALVTASFLGAIAGIANVARYQCLLRERARRRGRSRS